MSNTPSESSACQELVYLNVGGTPFKMLRSTVLNYPDSFIAKILRACPQTGQESQPMYIDRNPKLFNWILEIYRGGDYEGSLPRSSAKLLKRELDFYQLPSLEELEMPVTSPDSSFSAETMAKKLMQDIVDEIKEGGIQEMYPWCVYIYYQIFCDDMKPQRRILAIPDAVRSTYLPVTLGFLKARSHDDFVRVVFDPKLYLPEITLYAFRYQDELMYIHVPPTDDVIEHIKEEARLRGFAIEAKKMDGLKSLHDKVLEFTDIPFLSLRPLGY